MTCKSADKGNAQSETLIATLRPTAVDKVNYKPAIHEDIYLRMTVNDGMMQFAWSQNGKKFTTCGEPFKMREGKWIGAKIGFVAADTNPNADKGWIDADWIRITK